LLAVKMSGLLKILFVAFLILLAYDLVALRENISKPHQQHHYYKQAGTSTCILQIADSETAPDFFKTNRSVTHVVAKTCPARHAFSQQIQIIPFNSSLVHHRCPVFIRQHQLII
jgi:hypothetical protein